MKLLIVIFALFFVACAPLPPVVQPQYSRSSQQNLQDIKNLTGTSDWDDVLLPWLGTPYRPGGSSKRGADCSGFTSSVYMEKERKKLPRSSTDQFNSGKSVDRRNLAIGDLVFFGEKGKVSHVGIYTGNENFIHASSSNGVIISPLEDVYWKPRYIGAKRYL